MTEERVPGEPKQRVLSDLERGRDLSRIIGFTDGVFAIAATLLILQIDVPPDVGSSSALWDGIADQISDLSAYLFSFLVIGYFWIFHHRFLRTVREFDKGLMVLNIVYLLWVVLIPFTSQVMGEYGEFPSAIAVYAVNMSAVAVSAAVMQRHCLRHGLIDEGYEWEVDSTLKSNLFNAAYFPLAIPLSFLIGGWSLIIWFGLALDPFQRQRDRALADVKRRGRAGEPE
jgi:TMEM175 potassium channel family protein